jgi:hypothetical protein
MGTGGQGAARMGVSSALGAGSALGVVGLGAADLLF